MKLSARTAGRMRRKARVRRKISGTKEMPRLSVFKSARHICAQIIDDVAGVTLASAATYGKNRAKDSGNIKGAKIVGAALAEKALAKDIKNVVFDRGGYRYHGRIKALADAAREKGLKF